MTCGQQMNFFCDKIAGWMRYFNNGDPIPTNTAFNKNFGTGEDEVARGNHTHTSIGNNIIVDDTYSANNRDVIWADSSNDGFVIYLPTEFEDFDWIEVVDLKGTFEANNVTIIKGDNETIDGDDENLTLDVNYVNIKLQIVGSDWRVLR